MILILFLLLSSFQSKSFFNTIFPVLRFELILASASLAFDRGNVLSTMGLTCFDSKAGKISRCMSLIRLVLKVSLLSRRIEVNRQARLWRSGAMSIVFIYKPHIAPYITHRESIPIQSMFVWKKLPNTGSRMIFTPSWFVISFTRSP